MASKHSDPNPETGKLGLDKRGLEDFLEYRVRDLVDKIRKIQQDDPNRGLSLKSLIGDADYTTPEQIDSYGQSKPLSIGHMSKAEYLNGRGGELQEGVKKAIGSLITILEQQDSLFKVLEENLEDTIATIFSAQHKNLTKVDGREFLDGLEDVVDVLSPSGGSGDGNS